MGEAIMKLSKECIDIYSRADALNDGKLIDVSEMAKEAGFKYPTAVTAAVWRKVITPNKIEKYKLGQSENGRLWDVLWMLFNAIRSGGIQGDRGQFGVIINRACENGAMKNETVYLKSICSPGDDARPVVTIMMLNED